MSYVVSVWLRFESWHREQFVHIWFDLWEIETYLTCATEIAAHLTPSRTLLHHQKLLHLHDKKVINVKKNCALLFLHICVCAWGRVHVITNNNMRFSNWELWFSSIYLLSGPFYYFFYSSFHDALVVFGHYRMRMIRSLKAKVKIHWEKSQV